VSEIPGHARDGGGELAPRSEASEPVQSAMPISRSASRERGGTEDALRWAEHAPFLVWLLERWAPRRAVEVGVRSGSSFLTTCALQDRSVVSMVRCTPEDAASKFADASIDLLCVGACRDDGPVPRDLRAWLPKMSDRGVILVHGTREGRSAGSGVMNLWDAACPDFPHFEFMHAGGLGVLFVGEAVTPECATLRDALYDPARLEQLRGIFSSLGAAFAAERRAVLRSEALSEELRDLAIESELKGAALSRLHGVLEVVRAERDRVVRQLSTEVESLSSAMGRQREDLESLRTAHDESVAHASQLALSEAEARSAVRAAEGRVRSIDEDRSRLVALQAGTARELSAVHELLDQRWSELRGIYTSRIWRLMAPWRELATRLLGRPKTAPFSILGRECLRALAGRSAINPPPERDPLVTPPDHDGGLPRRADHVHVSQSAPGIASEDLWRLIAGDVRAQPRPVALPAGTAVEAPARSVVKAIAFLLPQFHPIPENDLWWGKGFTEWTGVARARPSFVGHHQPQLPADLGFYDLRLPEVREEQARLARHYGVHGFCYYHYWFGGRRLLHRPLDEVLESGKPDFPYCICWANENWTRTWDGNARDVLIEARHSKQDSVEFIRSLIPHFRDPRYIRVNGAPMLLVYRVDIVPDMAGTVAIWRDECRRAGVPGIHVASVQSFGIGDPRKYGCDASVEFPPHGTDMAWNCNAAFADRMLNPAFSGHIVDFDRVIDMSLRRAEPDYRLYRGVMPAWDNTARRQDNPLIFVNSTPERYEYWLSEIVRRTAEHPDRADRFVFINAWNEWAEGAHLEPDHRFGHRYLEATRRALAGEQRFPCLPPAPAAQHGLGTTNGYASAVAEPGSLQRSGAGAVVPERSTRLSWGSSVGAWVYRAGRGAFRRMPGYDRTRAGTIDWLFRHTGRVFAATAAHRDWLARQPQLGAQGSPRPLTEGLAASEADSPIVIPASEAPRVTVVIPVFNNWAHTSRCLRSIARTRPNVAFDVLVVDDCSTDDTSVRLSSAVGVRTMCSPVNRGFLASCNAAVDDCRGQYIVFLNNDTVVLEGWLDELVGIADGDPSVGLVGSMLVFPDGTLQEAGGIVFRDASGMNYGRGQDPRRPEFNYLRDPDYCSGASILVPRALFEALGRFDTRYSPAYYEDTDLAFRVREAGLRAVYNPLSRVIHHEGATSGTEVTRGVKAYQVANQSKFLSRWKRVLEAHGDRDADLVHERERRAGPRALVIDVVTPLPDQDSGSVDTLSHLRVLLSLGFRVTFAPNSLAHHGRYTETLQRMGIECLYGPFVASVRDFLQREGHRLDLVIVKRIECAAVHIDDLRRFCTGAKIIFDTVDLHYMRELRRAEVEGSRELRRLAMQTRKRERSVIRKSHATVVISDVEGEQLAKDAPGANVRVIPFIRDVIGSRAPFSRRSDLAFVGGYLHAPNVDAVVRFCADVWPLVHARLPHARFRLIGSNMPSEVRALGSIPGVSPEGFVADLGMVFDAVRLSVAPLRFGAGIKGKVATSLSYGVPCVMSPLAAEGMGIESGVAGVVVESPQEWADAVVRVYEDESLWNRLSQGGMTLLEERYSWSRGVERWREAIASVGAPVRTM
jgi:GT2 family glycosyltransferase/glycosyltransferase involved in cell wall biosynthesis